MRRSIHRLLILTTAAATAWLMGAGPALAHHSTAMFNMQKTLELHGVVKEFQYTNPHSWLIVDVKRDDGTTQTWGFEAEGPSTMMRAGIPKGSLKPGTEVTVTTHPMSDGRPAGQWIKVVKADGTVLNPRPEKGH